MDKDLGWKCDSVDVHVDHIVMFTLLDFQRGRNPGVK